MSSWQIPTLKYYCKNCKRYWRTRFKVLECPFCKNPIKKCKPW